MVTLYNCKFIALYLCFIRCYCMVCRCLILHQSHAVMISLLRILVYPVLSFDSWAKSVSKNAQNTKKKLQKEKLKNYIWLRKKYLINLSRLSSTPKQKTKIKKLKAINFKKYLCFLLYIYSPLEMKCIERKNWKVLKFKLASQSALYSN